MAQSCCIPLSHAPKATPLFLDYLYHYDRVAAFYSGPPQELSSFEKTAAAISGHYPHRAPLVEILERQNRAFGCGDATLANIRRLSDPGVFAAVSGQQVGLFSGPAFTLFKALTVVRVARTLTEKGLSCVPVFWLATEDHDLEEVAKTAVLNEGGERIEVEVRGDRPAPACSVGYVKLSAQVRDALAAVEGALPEGDARDQIMRDLRECYAPGAGWGESFARFIARLFGRFGVILLNPLCAEFHGLARGVYSRALEEAPRLRGLLGKRSSELTGAGYHAQVHVGADSTLMFAAVGGNRTAVRLPGESFNLDGRDSLSVPEMAAWVNSHPLDFTPSALLRPIVQDALLPTVAYIPGPSELAYFAQSQAIYAEFGRPMPVLYPRAGFTVADRHTQRLMEKYRLTLEDLWRGEEHLRRRIAAVGVDEGAAGGQAGGWSGRMDRGEDDLKRFFDQLAGDVERIDPTLIDALRNAQEKMNYQVERLRGKISRAALGRSELLTRHEKTLMAHLMPGGNLQERELSGINFLGRAGYGLLDDLLEQVQACCLDHQYFVS